MVDPSLAGEDTGLLRWASSSSDDLDLVSPYRLRLPLSPSLAAEQEGVRIDPGPSDGSRKDTEGQT